MAALSVRQSSSSRIVLGVPVAQRLSSLVSLVVVFIALFSFVGPLFDTRGSADPLREILGNPITAIVLLIMAFFFLRTLSSALVSSTVQIDSTSRTTTRSTSLFGVPLNKTEISFDRTRRVLVRATSPVLVNQSGGRAIWQVALEPTEGQPFVVNSNGSHTEMAALAAQVSTLMNRPVSDEMAQAGEPQVEQIFRPLEDFEGGTGAGGMPPVALPGPFTRRPASAIPEKNLPPATLSSAGAPAEVSKYGGESSARQPEPAPAPTYTEYVPAPLAPPMTVTSAESLFGPSMPPLGTAMDFGAPPTAGPAVQPMAPDASPAQPDLVSTGPIMGVESVDPYSAPLGDIKAPETPIPEVSSIQSATSARAQVDDGRRLTIEDLLGRIREDPTDALSYYRIARLLYARRAYADALDAYQNALHLDPTRPDTWNDLGVLYYMRGQAREAEAAFRRASGLDPFSGSAHYNLGLLLTRTGRRIEGATEFRRAASGASNESEQKLYESALGGNLGDPILAPVP